MPSGGNSGHPEQFLFEENSFRDEENSFRVTSGGNSGHENSFRDEEKSFLGEENSFPVTNDVAPDGRSAPPNAGLSGAVVRPEVLLAGTYTRARSTIVHVIARLRGELVEVGGGRVTLDVGGVGYEILIPESVAVSFPATVGHEVTLLIRQTFREDGTFLYGFTEPFQRRLFDLLTDVKGCGPKTSLALIGEVGEQSVAAAIVAQDPRTLAKATGVGPRLAERIILELREKIQTEPISGRSVGLAAVRASAPSDDDLLEALLALGYRRQDAEAAADKAREQTDDLTLQIRAALNVLKR